MANVDKAPEFACSSSVQRMRDDLGDELVTSVDVTGYLLGAHPEYGQGLAAGMVLAREAGAVRRTVDEWLSDVSKLYEDKERPLDGRLVILGLALMERYLQRALRRDDFLYILMAEYEPDYDSLLSPTGKDLFYHLVGRPRMEEPAEESKGIAGPGATGDSYGIEPVDLEGALEGLETMPMAVPDEDEIFEAMLAEDEVHEAAIGPDAEEMPENGGKKGIEPESTKESTPFRQARRLEAAMPESVQVQQTTELLVMLPRAGSEGLRAYLPMETEAGEIIDKDDVEERGAELEFEAPDKPLTVYFAVEAAQKDFEIEEPLKRVKSYADRDGDYEVFYLTPLRATSRAPVQVRLYRDEALTEAVSTIRLFTKIEPPDLGDDVDPQIATLWRAAAYAHVPLNLNVSGDYISVGAISGATGVAIGGGASAVVSHTDVMTDAGKITQLFTPLLRLVFGNAPLDQIDPAIDNVQALQVEVEKGPTANDPQIAALLQLIIRVVPAARTAVLELFGYPEVSAAAGDATRVMLEHIEQE